MRKLILLLCICCVMPAVRAHSFTVSQITGLTFDTNSSKTSITHAFKVGDLLVRPQALTLEYESSNATFMLYGSATLHIEGETLKVHLGSSDDPGIKVKSGGLEHFNIGITEDFELKGLAFKSKGLTLEWTKNDHDFRLYGEADVHLEKDSIQVKLGDQSDPGIEIKDGVFQRINVNITEDFELNGLSLKAKKCGINWINENTQKPEVITAVNFDGATYIEVGNHSHFYSNTYTFSFWLRPNSNEGKMDIISRGESTFHIYKYDSDKISFAVKDSKGYHSLQTKAGLPLNQWSHVTCIFDGGSSKRFEIWINGFKDASRSAVGIGTLHDSHQDLTIGMLAPWSRERFLKGQLHSVCIWNNAMDVTKIYDAQFQLPDANDSHLLACWAMDENTDVYAHDISQHNITAPIYWKPSWYTETVHIGTPGKAYNFYGDVTMLIDGKDTIDIDLGTAEHPGVVISDGAIEKIDIVTNDVFKLGNMTADAENVHFTYDHESEKFQVAGVFKLTDIWDAELDLGIDGAHGLTIDCSGEHPRFDIENFKVIVDNVTLGSIELKEAIIDFENGHLQDAQLDVLFPPAWEVEGEMKFSDKDDHLAVESIMVDWQAKDMEEAIELGATGMLLIEMKGEFDHLDDLRHLVFVGEVTIVYGGPFTFDNKEISLVEMTDKISISHDYLKLDADVELGAYKHGDEWRNYLGTGSLAIDLHWHKYYKLVGQVTMPADKMVEFDLLAYISNQRNIDVLAEMDFYVPHFVPIIGGDKLASADGALRYLYTDKNNSYAAAWYSVHIPFLGHVYKGAKYTIGTGHLGTIGHGSINDITKEIHHDIEEKSLAIATENKEQLFVSHSFVLDHPKTSALWLEVDWGALVDTAHIQVDGPEGVMYNVPIYCKKDTLIQPSDFSTGEELVTVLNDSMVNLVLHYATDNGDVDRFLPLPQGEYYVKLLYNAGHTVVDSLKVNIDTHHPLNYTTLDYALASSGEIVLTSNYGSFNPDSAIISFCVAMDSSTTGSPIVHDVFASSSDNELIGQSIVAYRPLEYVENQALYFYSIIDDGVNTPCYSNILKVDDYRPPIQGRLLVNNDSCSGFKFFIDTNKNGIHDKIDSTTYEKAVVTSDDGYFSFNHFIQDTTSIVLSLPYGYSCSDSAALEWTLYPAATSWYNTFEINYIKP